MIGDSLGGNLLPHRQLINPLPNAEGNERLPAARILRDKPIHVSGTIGKTVEQLNGPASWRQGLTHPKSMVGPSMAASSDASSV